MLTGQVISCCALANIGRSAPSGRSAPQWPKRSALFAVGDLTILSVIRFLASGEFASSNATITCQQWCAMFLPALRSLVRSPEGRYASSPSACTDCNLIIYKNIDKGMYCQARKGSSNQARFDPLFFGAGYRHSSLGTNSVPRMCHRQLPRFAWQKHLQQVSCRNIRKRDRLARLPQLSR